jgi:hypothetical protein
MRPSGFDTRAKVIVVDARGYKQSPHLEGRETPANRALTETEALEFLDEWKENGKGRADEPKPKDVPKSRLEIDMKITNAGCVHEPESFLFLHQPLQLLKLIMRDVNYGFVGKMN